MKTIFLRVLKSDHKEVSLHHAIQQPNAVIGRERFEVDPYSFPRIPRSPFAYWASEQMLRSFVELPSFETNTRMAKQGLATSGDFRFVRTAWEVPAKAISLQWFPFAKGGIFSPFYADVHMLVNWAANGRELKSEVDRKYSHIAGYQTYWVVKNPDSYLRPGLTWPRRTQSGLAFRTMPAGCIFADKGPAAFVAENDKNVLLALLALTTSSPFRALVDLQMAFGSFEVGVIQRTPVPALDHASEVVLATLAHRAWSLKRAVDASVETSHAFFLPALLQGSGSTLASRTAKWVEKVRDSEENLKVIQEEIDIRCFRLYGLEEHGQSVITSEFSDGSNAPNYELGEDVADSDEELAESIETSTTTLASTLSSWSVGVAFGRFDVRLATGERAVPAAPEPFDPLPACSPGMLTGDDGFPLAAAPAGYPIAFPADGMLVDDEGHSRDLIASVRTVFGVIFGADADARWEEAGTLLEERGRDLRRWLASSFFDFHLKRYSKSRRKAPIYWQLATPSGRYSLWLYAHRLTRDTFFQAQQDLLGPKLVHEERRLLTLTQEAGPNPSAIQRREIAGQEAFVDELRAMRDEVARIAPLWNPVLDDGVLLTMAPLWRLIPQHRAWQKELKAAWDALSAGKYDWSHLAMHLWPERVVPKCVEDRSLAIAHGLEDVFWMQDGDENWIPRDEPNRSVEELVAERTSPAVKAALASLQNAPAPTAAAGRGRRASKSGNGGAR